jgi:DNA polymerase elongation subunit (family B)
MIKVYDIETFSNCFTYTDYDPDTKEIKTFVISSFKDEQVEFRAYLDSIQKAGMVGFNNIFFDWPVTNYIWNSEHITAEKIYAFVQELISSEERKSTPQTIKQLDLFLLNHYDNKARSTSLKALEVALGWNDVQDMPYSHTEKIDQNKLEFVLNYNKNDVLFTAKFYEMCTEKIDLRKQISKKYKLNVINKSDVVIGETIFLKYLSDAMDMTIGELKQIRGKRSDVPIKDIIFPYVKYEAPQLQSLLQLMRETKSSPNFLQNFVEHLSTNVSTNELYDKLKKNNIDVKKTAQQKKSFSFSIHYAGVRLDYGVGGIHGCITPGVYTSTDTVDILDIDVKSYYPNLFIQNRLHPRQMDQDTFVQVYSDIFDQRVKAQKEGDKLTADALKLSLNGLFGKTGSNVSCFYDPFVFYAVTVNGQLLISMLVEKLFNAGCKILQVNTDGVTVSHNKNIKEKVLQICKDWEVITKLTLEYANYERMVIRDVNNYIAVSTDGKIKEKGAFETKKDWHKDNSYMVVPLAVRNYFVYDKPIEETLREHKNILDFCGRYKAGKGWHVEYAYLDGLQEKRLQFGKIYRYIPVHKGGTSLKLNLDGREHHLCEGSMTVPYNQIVDFDWNNINYPFFVNECQKLIQTIQPLQMTLL